MRVAGKVAVITGAGGGIGRATAELLASEGAKVLGGDLSLEGMEAVIGAVKEAAGKAVGNEKLQAEGMADKVVGSGKEAVGKAKDAVHKATK